MDVLFLDEHLLVVDKPAGVATLPGGWEAEPDRQASLLETLEKEHGKLWVVHRLDRSTSGVILFARDAGIHRALNRLFETRQVRKTYHAIVCGDPAWQEHTARHRLRLNSGHRHRSAVDHAHGKPAATRFTVLERLWQHALVEAVPETGRTHQVRAHAAALGYPLLADSLYGAPETEFIARTALHALSLELELDGRLVTFSAPHPPDLQRALEKLRAGL